MVKLASDNLSQMSNLKHSGDQSYYDEDLISHSEIIYLNY